MRRAFVLLAACLLLCSCAGNPPVRGPKAVKAEGVLRVAAGNQNEYPYLYWNERGECAGIEADIAKALAKALGVSAKFTPYNPQDVAPAVEQGAADIGFACIAKGGTRGGLLLETRGYYVKRPYVLTRRGEFYPSESAMENRTVLCDYAYQYSFAENIDGNTGMARLMEKTADAMICDEFTAVAAVRSSGEALAAELLQNGGEATLAGIVARQNETLYTLLDSELKRLLDTGEIAEIAAAYFD